MQDLEIDAAFAVGHLRSGLLQKIATVLERLILRSFDAVVTISNKMKHRLGLKGVRAERLSVIRNWVDLEKIKPLEAISSYRSDLGIPAEIFVALYAGNIGPKQALPVVLDAAKALLSDPDVLFVIVGDGPEKTRLMSQYGQLTNVRFLPVQPEEKLCELLGLADVQLLPQMPGAADLVLPSKLGGMLASGKPCIVMTDSGTELYEFLGSEATILPPATAQVWQRRSNEFDASR